MISIKPYHTQDKKRWDTFVQTSKNGTFVLQRDYMEYHQDRFEDASLLVFKDQTLIAILPANKQHNTLISHAGLTYGGLVYDTKMTQFLMIKTFQALIAYLIDQEIITLTYKTIPTIYHKGPAEEDRYALFLLNAELIRRDSLTVIDRDYSVNFQTRRKRAIKEAQKQTFTVQQSNDFVTYWHLLTHNLQTKHNVGPVHNCAEIQFLAEKFPSNIKLFICCKQDELLAGIVVYETDMTAHFQYIAASDTGKNQGALDWLFEKLIKNIYATKRYVDFGISNEQNGKYLNQGLADFKEGFGGRTIIHDYYHIPCETSRISQLDRAIL